MHTVYPDRKKLGQTLKEAGNSSFCSMYLRGISHRREEEKDKT